MHINQSTISNPSSSIDGITWQILGQTYMPKFVNGDLFSWHANFPPGTFVPPHIHPDQDEFLFVLAGELTFWLNGDTKMARAGDLAILPRGEAHGIYNKSDKIASGIFWVAPTQQLFKLFEKIHNLSDPSEVVRTAADHNIHFLPE